MREILETFTPAPGQKIVKVAFSISDINKSIFLFSFLSLVLWPKRLLLSLFASSFSTEEILIPQSKDSLGIYSAGSLSTFRFPDLTNLPGITKKSVRRISRVIFRKIEIPDILWFHTKIGHKNLISIVLQGKESKKEYRGTRSKVSGGKNGHLFCEGKNHSLGLPDPSPVFSASGYCMTFFAHKRPHSLLALVCFLQAQGPVDSSTVSQLTSLLAKGTSGSHSALIISPP